MRKNSSTSGCSALAAKYCFIRGVCSSLDISSAGGSRGRAIVCPIRPAASVGAGARTPILCASVPPTARRGTLAQRLPAGMHATTTAPPDCRPGIHDRGEIMYRKQPKPAPLTIAVLAVLAAFGTPAASAQDAAQDAAANTRQEAKTLDTLVVTAQKREEALQDVPVMVTALSQDALQDAGVRDIKDLQALVPGLTVTSTQSDAITTARIRGIGTVGDNVGLESSVGVVIDGVYRPRNSVGFGDLGELERIEVLKGPQGTVFGKNTSAGVINVVTRRPDFVRSGEVELTLGTPGATGVAASFNTPVGETNAFRIFATKRSREGFMDVHTGAGPRDVRDDYDQDYSSVRAQWRIAPNDDLDINFIADATR